MKNNGETFKELSFILVGERPGWQTRIASLLHYDKASVSRWASGAVRPPISIIMLMHYMVKFGTPEVLSDEHDG